MKIDIDAEAFVVKHLKYSKKELKKSLQEPAKHVSNKCAKSRRRYYEALATSLEYYSGVRK